MPLKAFYTDDTFLRRLMKVAKNFGARGKSLKMVDMITKSFNIIQIDTLLEECVEKSRFAADYSHFIALNFNNIRLETQEEVLVAVSNISELLSPQISDFLSEADDDQDEISDGGKIDSERQAKMDAMLGCLLALVRLREALITDYSISNSLLMKYQENGRSSDFKAGVTKAEKSSFDLSDIDLDAEEEMKHEKRVELIECLREEA